MKKLLCLLLTLMMLLALLAGCDSDSDRRRDDDDDDSKTNQTAGDGKPGKKDDDDDEIIVDDDDDVAADDDDVAVDDDDDTEDAPASSTTEPPTTEPPTTEPPTTSTELPTESVEEASDLSLGYWEGNTYINEYAGFVCSVDDSWQIYTAEELQELPEQIKEVTGGEKLSELMADFQQFTDMMAENVTDLTTVNLLYQKVPADQLALFRSISEEEAIDLTLQQVAQLEAYYNSMGITVHSQEKVKVTFLGEEHYALYSVMEIQGIPYYTLQLQNFTLGEYGVTLTLASYVEDNTQSMLELFAPLN